MPLQAHPGGLLKTRETRDGGLVAVPAVVLRASPAD
jgi:hypothetical protein